MSFFSAKAARGHEDTGSALPRRHAVLDVPLEGPWSPGAEVLYVAMGCFWGAERLYWSLPGVISTAVGYMGGQTPEPTYGQVCTGRTGHTEAAQIVYDPEVITPAELLKVFWENHDPTTRNRQGNDIGTQYRSAIYWTTPDQGEAAETTRAAFQEVLSAHGHRAITTELAPAETAGPFFYAETEHQQYLHKHPRGYCNHGPNGLTCPIGVLRQDELPAQRDITG